MSVRKSFAWDHGPVIIAAGFAVYCIVLAVSAYPDVNFDPLSGELSGLQAAAIERISNLNDYFITLCTSLFVALGFFLRNYLKTSGARFVIHSFGLALLFLIVTYYLAFRVHTQLIGELGSDALDIFPKTSMIIYFLKLEFWTCLAATTIIFSSFILVLSKEK